MVKQTNRLDKGISFALPSSIACGSLQQLVIILDLNKEDTRLRLDKAN